LSNVKREKEGEWQQKKINSVLDNEGEQNPREGTIPIWTRSMVGKNGRKGGTDCKSVRTKRQKGVKKRTTRRIGN